MQFPSTQSPIATHASTSQAHINLVEEINSFEQILAIMPQTKADDLAKILPEKLVKLSSLIEIFSQEFFSQEIVIKNLGKIEDLKLIKLAHSKVKIIFLSLENSYNLSDANSIAVSILAKKCLFVECYSQNLNPIIEKYNATFDSTKLKSYIKVNDQCLEVANLCEMLTVDSIKDHRVIPYCSYHPVSMAVTRLMGYWNSYGEDLKKRNRPRSGASFDHIAIQTINTIENVFRKLATFKNENACKAYDILYGCRSACIILSLIRMHSECSDTLKNAERLYNVECQRKDEEEDLSMLARKGQIIYPFQNLNRDQRKNALKALKTIDFCNAEVILEELDENPVKFAEKTRPELLKIAATKISESRSEANSGQGQNGIYEPQDVRESRQIRCENRIAKIDKALNLINADFKTVL